jgi:hypothetical protein
MNPILVLTFFSYKDALFQTYTLPYVKIISCIANRKIYVVCLENPQRNTSHLERKEINEALGKENIEIIFLKYYRFGIKQILAWFIYFLKFLYIIFRKRIEILHGWCVTGGSIAYLLSVLSGKKLILDSYEPHAELMTQTNTWSQSSLAYKILFKLEELQTKRAKIIIGVVSKMVNYSLEKYNFKIDETNFYVKPACVDFEKFYLRDEDVSLKNDLKLNNKIVCVYAGKIGGIYLENELFDFLKQCYIYWGERFAMLMLTNASKKEVGDQVNRVGVPLSCIVQKFVDHNDIPRYMALGNFAVNFMKPVPARRYSTPIKDGEYWAMGLPIVITEGISDDSDIIRNNDIGYVLKSLTNEEYLCAIRKIDDLLTQDGGLKSKIEQIGKKYRNFALAENVYQKIYNN